jgi:hypothetical protein
MKFSNRHQLMERRGFWGQTPESGDARGTRGAARIRRLRLIFSIGAMAALFATTSATAADISSCGAALNKAGFYQVTQNLTASSGDCIDVNVADTIIYLNGHGITGSGSGVGIKFESRAKNSFLEGANATISGFAIGVADYASSVHGDNFNANGNGAGGVLVSDAQESYFSNFQASGNGAYGIEFLGGSNDVAESAQADANGSYGIWLDGASGVRIDNFDTEQNKLAGVYIGCASNGPGTACSGAKHVASSNQIYDGFADGNGPYGIAIDASASGNLVTSVEAMSNSSDDMIDLNKCGVSSWFGNQFTSASPSGCIN